MQTCSRTRFVAIIMALVVGFTVGIYVPSFAQVNAYTITAGAASPLTQGGAPTILGGGINLDDDVFPARPIGFVFPFNGANYSTVNVSVNGWLSFGTPITSSQKFFYPLAASGGSGVIAAFATDLRGTGNTQILTRTVGTAPNRQFIVTYQNVTLFNAGMTTTFSMTFEVILQENGVIRANFSPVTNPLQFPSSLVQVGLRGATASDFMIRQSLFSGANVASSNVVFQISSAQIAQIQSLQATLTPPATTPAQPTTFSISGTVRNSNGQGLTNVLISGGGKQTYSQNGSFTLTGLANGTYPLTASMPVLTFVGNGASTATINNANVTNVAFTALLANLSGTTRINNQALSGVTMSLTGSLIQGALTSPTGSNGGFTIGNLPNGTYTLTPTKNGYSFSPASRTITVVNGTSQSMLDFTASLIVQPTYTISGTVLNSQGQPMPNITLLLSTGKNAVTGPQGTFAFTNVSNGTYSLVATAPGMFFQNNRAVVTVNGANVVQNFTALTSQISGTVTVGGNPQTNVSVFFSNASNGFLTLITSGVGGQYARSLPPGTYTVYASVTGATFTPASTMVTLSSGASVSNINFTGVANPPASFTVSGRVISNFDGSGVSGVNMVLSTNPPRNAVSNASGNYSFPGVPAGMYTVTASGTGITFASPSQNITVSNAALSNVNFTAPLGRILGRITRANGMGLAGVTFTVGGTTATTNAVGDYALNNLRGGSYTLAPSFAGFAFTPQTLNVTLANGATIANQNFSAASTAPIFTISGRVTSSANPNTGIQGVTISAGANTTVTDAGGFYTLTNMANGAYTVSAARAGTTFTQASQMTTINEANVANVNFVAQLANISGTITVNGVGQGGITVSDGTRNATTNNSGNYIILDVPAGTYTLTPNSGTLTFTPVTRMVTVVAGVSQAGQNFTGAMPMMQPAAFAPPTLVNPANNSDIQYFSCNSPCVGFFWTLVPGAVTYRLQIASDMAFTNFQGQGVLQTNTANTSILLLASNFTVNAAGTTYFWRVQSIDANGTASSYSSANSFVLRPAQTESTLGSMPATIGSQFIPNVHGWNFSNSSNQVWNAAYLDAINYSVAPFSNFAAASPEWATKAATSKPNIFPFWDDFALGLGRAIPVYVNNNGVQTPTVNATSSWNPSQWGGSCYGFAITSIFGYAGIYNAQTPLFNVPVSNATRKIIHAHQVYQNFRIGAAGHTPNRTVQIIRDAIATGDRQQHPTISIKFSGPNGGGHAVVPYRIGSRLDAMGNATADSVFIYDMNHPGQMNNYIFVERATNFWRYDLAGLNAGVGNFVWSGTGSGFTVGTNARTERTINYAGRPIVALQSEEILPPLNVATVRFNAPTIDQAQPTVEVRTPSGGSIINTEKDPFGEDIKIPDAQPILRETGSLEESMPGIEGYLIPNENLSSLSIRYLPQSAGAEADVSVNDGNRFTVWSNWTPSSQRGQNLVSDFANSTARFTTQSAIPNWSMILATLSEDRTSWENVVRISGAAFRENDTMNIRIVNDGAQVVVENGPSPKNYSINFSRGTGQTFNNISIGAGETQTFVVSNWEDLQRSGFTQLLDRDSDGKIDGTNILRNPVSVRNEEQSAFAMSVFPNPASVQATVEFSLTQASSVQVDVVNVLGAVIISLPEASFTSGKHRMNLSTAELQSGMYFVRVRAQNGTSVSPLQIVR
ncbi:MAG: carboxypeptidase regulatory-like domain-containing protein [Candidatus Kapabacteria bacterium]|nr:carboxypeptidase regulatory-like domain-containing protein [Candidatus Kapabacteria bacterium]